MKAWVLAASFALTVFVALQIRRVLHTEKDVYTHHDSDCRRIEGDFHVIDLTKYQNELLIGLVSDPALFSSGAKEAKPGRLVYLDQSTELKSVQIRDFPNDVAFNPQGFYLLKPENLLYVLNYAFGPEPMRVEVFDFKVLNGTVSANHTGYVLFDSDISLTISDLIVTSESELYLSQRSPVPLPEIPSILHKLKTWAYDFFEIQASYVHQCTFKLNERAKCRPLQETKGISVTGITKDKFGDYVAAYGSVDSNSVKYFERNYKDGDFNHKKTIPIRDTANKLEWDEHWQRIYSVAVPWPITYPDYVGAVEYRNWEMMSGKVSRRLLMSKGLFSGAEVATRFDGGLYVGSWTDTGLLRCTIA